MDKEINQHKKFVKQELTRLQHSPDKSASRSLLAYHDIMTRNFQHERQIHLIVTLFFGGLMLASWIALLIVYLEITDFSAALIPMGLLVSILTVLEGFYIRYYYLLENRTQKLYELTDEIYRSMK